MFVPERQGDVAMTGVRRRLGQGLVHEVTLRVAAADLP
jgi:hypothetical protein